MRILLIVVYYLPSTKSSAKLMDDLAGEFLRLGHEPVVLTPDERLASPSEVTEVNGVKVLRVRTGKIDGASKIVRGINEVLLSAVLWRRGRKFFRENRCDLIVWYSPSIFFGALVKRLKKLFNCPSYLILRDIFPQWAVDMGVLKKGLVYQFFHRKEIEQYEAADIIGVQSPANLDYFHKNGFDKKYRLEVLYNWAKLEESDVPKSNFREKLGLQGKVVFFYGGNIGVAQDMDNLLRLAEGLRHEAAAHFLLVGSGSEVERLQKTIIDKKLSNIIIHGPVEQRQYLAMLSEFDVGLILLDRNLKTQNFPGKMLGYMYYSMPILASINEGNDLKNVIEKKGAGLISINGDDGRFYDNALRLLKDENLRRLMGRNARMLLEETFSVNRAAARILSHFAPAD
ncbi:MAG: glycosyltransferase family 4 protein [Candidatus Omnitrophota bacterium]